MTSIWWWNECIREQLSNWASKCEQFWASKYEQFWAGKCEHRDKKPVLRTDLNYHGLRSVVKPEQQMHEASVIKLFVCHSSSGIAYIVILMTEILCRVTSRVISTIRHKSEEIKPF